MLLIFFFTLSNTSRLEFSRYWYERYFIRGEAGLTAELIEKEYVSKSLAEKIVNEIFADGKAMIKTMVAAENGFIDTICPKVEVHTDSSKFYFLNCDKISNPVSISGVEKNLFPINFPPTNYVIARINSSKIKAVMLSDDFMSPIDFLQKKVMHVSVTYLYVKVAAYNYSQRTYFSGCQMIHPDCGADIVSVYVLAFSCKDFTINILAYSKSTRSMS